MKRSNQEIVQSLKKIAGQKFTWFALLMVSLTFTAFNTRPDATPDPFDISKDETSTTATDPTVLSAAESDDLDVDAIVALPKVEGIAVEKELLSNTPHATETIVKEIAIAKPAAPINFTKVTALTEYAQSLLGKPYNYGGTTPSGFDCSGFVYHVFNKFDREIERTSRSQGTQGREISVEEAGPGDLIFFTGTNPKVRDVGHVGIIISNPGEPVSFIHSSSNGGVKISDLEGYYTTRFMFAKRLD